MTYKETLFFIGKCLTINHEEKNKTEIETELKNNSVDWDAVVKLSTEHYVFPALYCNLKKVDFLHYLPEDLVAYMGHITNLNRERNQQIILQAREINELLVANNITPIFLKGTGNLLEGLYDDIGERMVGDIDFIVSKKEYLITINILKESGYDILKKIDIYSIDFKHYSKLKKNDRIASVEIHKELLKEKYSNEFNYNLIKNKIQLAGKNTVLSYQNQLILTIVAKQINDEGYAYKNMSLRNGYDLFLLSFNTKAKDAFKDFNLLYEPLICFLAISYEVFSKPKSLKYEKNYNTEKYIEEFYKLLANDIIRKKYNLKIKREIFLSNNIKNLKKIFFDKNFRKRFMLRIIDINWYYEKALYLNFLKNKKY